MSISTSVSSHLDTAASLWNTLVRGLGGRVGLEPGRLVCHLRVGFPVKEVSHPRAPPKPATGPVLHGVPAPAGLLPFTKQGLLLIPSA